MNLSSKRVSILRAVAVILFLSLVIAGFTLARKKPLWNDEIYTQHYSIDKSSYTDILSGRIAEGNRCPLYYLLHKAVCDIASYDIGGKTPAEGYVLDIRGQMAMRVVSDISMSLSLVLMFYFFSRYYSTALGIYALLLSFSSVMVWGYWAEARPYALWLLLTTIQSLLFLQAVRHGAPTKRVKIGLAVANILLALTVIFGLLQILCASLLLLGLKKLRYREALLIMVPPSMISLAFYLRTPKDTYHFWLGKSVFLLITENIPPERLAIIALFFILSVFIYLRREKSAAPLSIKPYPSPAGTGTGEGVYYLWFFFLNFLSVCALIAAFKINEAPKWMAFSVPSRYFICLVPLGIIATTLFCEKFVRYYRNNRWMLANIFIVLGGLLVMRMLKTFVYIFDRGLY